MKAFIEHESRGRLRVRMKQYRMTLEQADLLEAYLQNQPGVLNATVHERTCCAVIRYIGDRENIIRAIAQFNYTAPSVTALTPTHSGRALNREYQEKLVGKVITKFACTLFLPAPLQIARTIWLSLPFLGRGQQCQKHGKRARITHFRLRFHGKSSPFRTVCVSISGWTDRRLQ